jgi:hypothetical protein
VIAVLGFLFCTYVVHDADFVELLVVQSGKAM